MNQTGVNEGFGYIIYVSSVIPILRIVLTSAPQNSLLSSLNNEQLSAVTWPTQSALVLAGAGSGKTKVLTTRIAWLLHTGQASLHSVMAVTFTNKAAKEMRDCFPRFGR